MSTNQFSVHPESTPNPESMKFVVNQTIAEESISIDNPLKATDSPLAQKLFGFPWAKSVFIGKNFITLTKQDWVEWEIITDPLCDLIKEHLEMGEPVVKKAPSPEASGSKTSHSDSPVVAQIKEILNNEIRPAVAMDGGDIVFHKYEDKTVYLLMQGACSGCPSSTMTLKVGIEQRLKEVIPEIEEVVSV